MGGCSRLLPAGLVRLLVAAGDGVEVGPPGGGAGVFGFDEVQVVDPGRWRWRGGLLGAGFAVHVPADDPRPGQSHRFAVVSYVDVGQVERVEDEFDDPAGQERVDLRSEEHTSELQ